jgi:RimJ/RimL family protein N-acetyltransferase
MIIETSEEDYSDLRAGIAPRGLRLPDGPIADSAVLEMLAGVAIDVRGSFSPASWLIVEDGVVMGLCVITRPPDGRSVDIGYGIASDHAGRGVTGRAIGAVLQWAAADPRIDEITAETAIDNVASQRVLERNGFAAVGSRDDPEDGPLICWSRRLASAETDPGRPRISTSTDRV